MGECQQNEFLCTWKIKQYSVTAEKRMVIFSPYFRVGNEEWQIWFSPNIIPGNIGCYLHLVLPSHLDFNKTVTVGIQYTLKSSNGMILSATEISTETVMIGYYSPFRKLIGIDDLKKEMSSWSEDSLILCCRIQGISSEIPPHLSEVSFTGCKIETKVYDYEVSFMFYLKFSHNKHFMESKELNSNILEKITFEYIEDSLHIELFANIEDEPRHNFYCMIELLNELGNRVISDRRNIILGCNRHKYLFPVFIYKQNLEEANCYNCGVIKLNVIISPECTSKINYLKKHVANGRIVKLEDSPFVSPITEQCSSKLINVHTSSKACQTTSEITHNVTLQSGPSSNGEIAKTHGDNSLQHDLQKLFIDKLHTDVELRVGSELFPVHKSLLVARSRTFLSIFDQYRTENYTGVIDIHDVEGNIMKLFLEYIYTGSVDIMDIKVAMKLILVADKYEVFSLAEKCVSFLESVLCINNALDVLSVAEILNREQLKLYVIEYILNNSHEILSSTKWPQWTKLNPTLASEILIKMSKNIAAVLKSAKLSTMTRRAKARTSQKHQKVPEGAAPPWKKLSKNQRKFKSKLATHNKHRKPNQKQIAYDKSDNEINTSSINDELSNEDGVEKFCLEEKANERTTNIKNMKLGLEEELFEEKNHNQSLFTKQINELGKENGNLENDYISLSTERMRKKRKLKLKKDDELLETQIMHHESLSMNQNNELEGKREKFKLVTDDESFEIIILSDHESNKANTSDEQIQKYEDFESLNKYEPEGLQVNKLSRRQKKKPERQNYLLEKDPNISCENSEDQTQSKSGKFSAKKQLDKKQILLEKRKQRRKKLRIEFFPKSIKNRMCRLTKSLRKKNFPPEEIKDIIQKERRKAKKEFRKTQVTKIR